jgi:hypothetical protein
MAMQAGGIFSIKLTLYILREGDSFARFLFFVERSVLPGGDG